MKKKKKKGKKIQTFLRHTLRGDILTNKLKKTNKNKQTNKHIGTTTTNNNNYAATTTTTGRGTRRGPQNNHYYSFIHLFIHLNYYEGEKPPPKK